MRAWLAGQNIDLDKLSQSVEARRQARLKFSADQFAITLPAAPEPKAAEQPARPKAAADASRASKGSSFCEKTERNFRSIVSFAAELCLIKFVHTT